MEYENREFESEQEFTQAPNCQVAEQPIAPVQTVAGRVLPALKDTMFLVICILMSASCLISLSLGSIPIINILFTVFLWLTYAQSRKDIADAKHLRCISGTVYAQYVITYVAAGLFLFLGILFAVAFSFLMQDRDFTSRLLSMFVELDNSTYMLLKTIASVSGIVIFVVFALIAACMVLINIFTTRYIHRFAKSVYKSIEANTLELKHTNAAKICLYIFSGCSAISALAALGDFHSLLSNAATCAATFLAAQLIKKYFQAQE